MDYKLYQGDCLEVMGSIKDKSIDLIVTDPPYLMDYQSNRRKKEDRFDKIKLLGGCKMKIGQEMKFKNDFEIETMIKKDKIKVKKGDKAIVTKHGLKILNGYARGMILPFEKNNKPEGIDYENISKLIYQRLNSEYDMSEFFIDYEIDKKDFIYSIEDILLDIL